MSAEELIAGIILGKKFVPTTEAQLLEAAKRVAEMKNLEPQQAEESDPDFIERVRSFIKQ